MKNDATRLPKLKIGATQIKLLERLCNACAVSGMENEVRTIVLEEIRPHVADVKVDALGNVLAVRRGEGKDNPRLMLAAHMDEVGFILTAEDGDGIFRFEIVGGIDIRQLPGKPVWVGPEHLPGVIGARPIHLTKREEWSKAMPLDTLRIDIGAVADNKVKIGDRATFATAFARLGPSVRAKALDDRLGVATLIELLKNAPPNLDILAAFTTQEEIGLRGAKPAAYAFEPDMAIVIDSTLANDLPSWDGSENVKYNTRLGNGPAIYVADGATLSDPRLVRHLTETAAAEGIPCQIRQPGSGGTDAGSIHRQRAGVPTVSVSVPGRYLHTAASIARIADWENTLQLLYAALCRLPAGILEHERS